MRRTTTDGDPIAAASFACPGRTSPSPTSPRSGPSAGRASAASPTNPSEPRRSTGQVWWPRAGPPPGNARRLTGEYPAAADALQTALNLNRDLGDRQREANALNFLEV